MEEILSFLIIAGVIYSGYNYSKTTNKTNN
jgi:hypothetical protein